MSRTNRLRYLFRTSAPPPQAVEDDWIAPVDAAEAWKAVGLVNEWVRHAERKAAATLATSGVIGGVLFNLVKDPTEFSLTINILGPVCGALAFRAAIASVVALWPRLRATEPPTSLVNLRASPGVVKLLCNDRQSGRLQLVAVLAVIER